MKIKGLLIAILSVAGISGAFAQGVEYDDMYFNSEDRAKLKAQQTSAVAYNTPKESRSLKLEETYSVNPTDSYSARNVNPEYTSREHTESAQAEEDYFVDNYQYNTNRFQNWNNYNSWYDNSWYPSSYYGHSWNSPYGYNGMYDPYSPYSGWSSSFSFHYGRSWNYGYNNYWNRPYYGWDPYGMAYSGYGYGMGYGGYWNNYRYPGTVIVLNNSDYNGKGMVYGKRPTRGTSIVSDRNNVRSRSNVSGVRDENSSGRVSTQTQKQAEYYNRYNRPRTSTSGYDSRTNTQNNRPTRSWDTNTWDNNNSSYDNGRSNTRSSSPSPSYSPSRSSSDAGTRTNTSSGSSGRRGRD